MFNALVRNRDHQATTRAVASAKHMLTEAVNRTLEDSYSALEFDQTRVFVPLALSNKRAKLNIRAIRYAFIGARVTRENCGYAMAGLKNLSC